MRLSRYPINTLRESPAEADVVSQQLMLRAGLIKRLSTGLYSWLPLGLRTLRKVENIVREEMDRAGALELMMPAVQPAELWQESGRWDAIGDALLRFTDHQDRRHCLGPAHEEVITDIARRELKSYRQLPVTFYQIQMTFRDESRPRFGVLGARERITKDAYSFHLDEASLREGYQAMYDAYTRIFTRMGLTVRAVEADSRAIGGNRSQEFHVLARSGEDAIAVADEDDYAAILETAIASPPADPRAPPAEELRKVPTPGVTTIDDLCTVTGLPPTKTIKTLVYEGTQGLVALLVRGDHQLNEFKAARLPQITLPLTPAAEAEVRAVFGAGFGSLGPLFEHRAEPGGLAVIADHSVAAMSDFAIGANEDGMHYMGVNWERDLPSPAVVADLRTVVEGDPGPTGKGRYRIVRGIEVGRIVQLGRTYTESMDFTVLDESGKAVTPEMGRYGIGVSRVVAAAIEQNHDDRGIVWPAPLAPFDLALVPINQQKSPRVRELADRLYDDLTALGIDVLYDDRDARPGVKFADTELLGIPHRVVVGERGLDSGKLEYRARRATESEEFAAESALDFIRARLAS